VAGGDGRKRSGSAGVVGKTHLIDGARLTERRERRPDREGVNRKEKRISREDATDAPSDFSLRGRHGQWAGWARGQEGHVVGRAENQEKKEISELKLDF
jgi:hypothetical protein